RCRSIWTCKTSPTGRTRKACCTTSITASTGRCPGSRSSPRWGSDGRCEMRRPWISLVALVASACGEGFLPVTYVDDLRVLALRAEPPEIAWDREGFSTESEVSALVADPVQLRIPEREVVVGYLACTPDPADPAPGPCTAVATLRAPAEIGRHLPDDLCQAAPGGPSG